MPHVQVVCIESLSLRSESLNAAQPWAKSTTGLGLAGVTEGVIDHEGQAIGAPGKG